MSLAEIARALDLSVTTVSRALGGFGEVAVATRERVRAEAERIGYRANATARRLQSGRAGAVGLVLPTGAGQFDDPFFLRLIAAIGPPLAEADVDLLVTAASPGADELRAYERLVDGRRVDGMLVARTRRKDERIRFLLDRKIPFVAHGRTEEARPYAWVDTDGAAAMSGAASHMLARGHRRIGMLNATPNFHYAEARAAGWRDTLIAAGLAADIYAEADPIEAAGARASHTLLDLAERPTALLCATDRLAAGAMRAAASQGLIVGRDIGIIGFDDLPFAGYLQPRLTTIEQPVEQAGIRMVEMLLGILAGADPASLNTLLPTRLIQRESAGPYQEADPRN